MKKSNKGE